MPMLCSLPTEKVVAISLLGLQLSFLTILVLFINSNSVFNMKNYGRSSNSLKSAETMRLIFSIGCGVMFGLFIGISFPTSSLTKIWVSSNPRGAEKLPPGLVASESDYYLRRLWGNPSEDLPNKPKCLVTFTVGIKQKYNIDACVKKFSDDFTILLFHYDGKTNEWDEFEWSQRAIHISARKQTKWWYAKRFLHPDIVAPYDYIFIWDEDLGVEHFDGMEYIKLVKKHGLEISQPGLDPRKGTTWPMTIRRENSEVHMLSENKSGKRCSDPHLPPCAAFVEIMAPVFSRDAWRCVWHMIQNDLIHGWGLDFALHKCVEPAHEKIGVVDAQWIIHQSVPSLGNEGQAKNGKAAWRGVRERCEKEWSMFQSRAENAQKDYHKSNGVDTSNFTYNPNGMDPSKFISHSSNRV
ncbi:hypothetical protein BC332_25141 [Capsicum chinense]|nr:hypothetical protein BC332_25141 [Capsicum chinense]